MWRKWKKKKKNRKILVSKYTTCLFCGRIIGSDASVLSFCSIAHELRYGAWESVSEAERQANYDNSLKELHAYLSKAFRTRLKE